MQPIKGARPRTSMENTGNKAFQGRGFIGGATTGDLGCQGRVQMAKAGDLGLGKGGFMFWGDLGYRGGRLPVQQKATASLVMRLRVWGRPRVLVEATASPGVGDLGSPRGDCRWRARPRVTPVQPRSPRTRGRVSAFSLYEFSYLWSPLPVVASSALALFSSSACALKVTTWTPHGIW